MSKNEIPKEAIEAAVVHCQELYGNHDEGIAAAAKAEECSVEDVFEVSDSRFQNVAERFNVDCSELLSACLDDIFSKKLDAILGKKV